MAYRGLDEFLIRLEQSGELVHIQRPIHPTADLPRLLQAHGDKALIVSPRHSAGLPLVVNLFGTERRMAWALGVESLDALTDNLAALIAVHAPLSFGAVLNRAALLMSALRSAGAGIANLKNCPVQAVQVSGDAPLDALPTFKLYPEDSHSSITMAQLITQAPEGATAIHLVRAVVLDSRTLGVELPDGIKAAQKTLPAALVLGGDPAAMWCANAPLPVGIVPYWLAGWLRKRAVPFCRARTQALDIPADAEIAIEGVLDLSAMRHDVAVTAEYGLHRPPIAQMTVTAITHRPDAVFPVHLPTPLGAERHWMTRATERLFLPALRMMVEGVADMTLPLIGGGRNLLILSTKQRQRGQIRRMIHGLWGLGTLAQVKAVIVVRDDVNIHDLGAVLTAVLCRVDWRRDVIRIAGMVHPHDTSGEEPGYTGKIALDATGSALFPCAFPSVRANGIGEDWRVWNNILLAWAHPAEAHQLGAALQAQNPDYHVILLDSATQGTPPDRLAWDVLAEINWLDDLTINAAGRCLLNTIKAAKR